MKGKRKIIKGGQPEQDFIGCYIDPALKRRLRVLAGLRQTTVSAVLVGLVEEATAPLAGLVDAAAQGEGERSHA